MTTYNLANQLINQPNTYLTQCFSTSVSQ